MSGPTCLGQHIWANTSGPTRLGQHVWANITRFARLLEALYKLRLFKVGIFTELILYGPAEMVHSYIFFIVHLLPDWLRFNVYCFVCLSHLNLLHFSVLILLIIQFPFLLHFFFQSHATYLCSIFSPCLANSFRDSFIFSSFVTFRHIFMVFRHIFLYISPHFSPYFVKSFVTSRHIFRHIFVSFRHIFPSYFATFFAIFRHIFVTFVTYRQISRHILLHFRPLFIAIRHISIIFRHIFVTFVTFSSHFVTFSSLFHRISSHFRHISPHFSPYLVTFSSHLSGTWISYLLQRLVYGMDGSPWF